MIPIVSFNPKPIQTHYQNVDVVIDRIDRRAPPVSRHIKLWIAASLILICLPLITAASLLAAGWSQLSLFNMIIPHDQGTKLIESGVVYGPHPRHALDIYGPEDHSTAASGLMPVLVFYYGGSWNSGSRVDYEFVGRAFAAAGYVTVIADYRLVPEVRFPEFIEDSASAFAWVTKNIDRVGGDPNRIFIAGHSAGAYNAMVLALDADFLDAHGIGTEAIKGVAGLSGPYDFLPLKRDSTRAAFSGVTDLKNTQPVNLVRRRAPPIFLATGDQDDLVRPKNTRALAAAMTSIGVAAESRLYPGVDHAGTLLAISRPYRAKAPVINDVLAFFRGL